MDQDPTLFSDELTDDEWAFLQTQRSRTLDREKYRKIKADVQEIRDIRRTNGTIATNQFCSFIDGAWYRIWTDKRHEEI